MRVMLRNASYGSAHFRDRLSKGERKGVKGAGRGQRKLLHVRDAQRALLPLWKRENTRLLQLNNCYISIVKRWTHFEGVAGNVLRDGDGWLLHDLPRLAFKSDAGFLFFNNLKINNYRKATTNSIEKQ